MKKLVGILIGGYFVTAGVVMIVDIMTATEVEIEVKPKVKEKAKETVKP